MIERRWFWKGIKYDIPLCCIMFFISFHAFELPIREYSSTMCKLTDNAGKILCPECLIKQLK